jgi:hypothetical protein
LYGAPEVLHWLATGHTMQVAPERHFSTLSGYEVFAGQTGQGTVVVLHKSLGALQV